MKKTALSLMVVALGACSGDSAKEANNGWQLGDDAGNNAATDMVGMSSNNGTTAPGNNSTTSPVNNATTTPTNNGTTTPTNNATTTPTNNGTTTPTNNMTMGTGTVNAGEVCALNSDCAANLTCCPGFGGDATCESRCFGGGLCAGNDAECAMGEECCDLSAINQPDSCSDRCRGGMNPPGMACTTNPDCTGVDEVCCLGFDGAGECTTECFTGGACEADPDCSNGQLCCDFSIAKVCLDQCNF